MKRNVQIDIAKGLGAFLVVTGHIVPGIVSEFIFLFHMPFFFIVSGYLYKPEKDEVKYCKRKSLSLLLPYIVYLFIFSARPLASHLYAIITYPSATTVSAFLELVARLIYGGELLKGPLGIFWFITCLFLTQQIYNILWNRTNTRILLISAIFLYIAAVINQNAPNHIAYPWAVNVVCSSFLFYIIGAQFGNHILKNRNMMLFLLSLIISVAGLVFLGKGFKLSFNMKYTYYGWFVISPIIAIALTMILAYVAYILTKSKITKRSLGFAGKASITIMFTHQALHFLMEGSSQKWPWMMTGIIFMLGCILHYVLSTNSLTRALLLGSRQDIVLLTRRHTWTAWNVGE